MLCPDPRLHSVSGSQMLQVWAFNKRRCPAPKPESQIRFAYFTPNSIRVRLAATSKSLSLKGAS